MTRIDNVVAARARQQQEAPRRVESDADSTDRSQPAPRKAPSPAFLPEDVGLRVDLLA